MELEQAILERRSIRRFTDQPVEKEKLEALLKAAIWAPTAGNIQPWVFVCVQEPKMVKKIRAVSPGMLWSTSAVICVCSDQQKAAAAAGKGGPTLALFDSAMAAQNILLRAHDLGLGSCVIRSFNPAAVRELLSAPEHVQPELLIILGYPDQKPSPPPRKTDTLFWETYGRKE
jgi:nitroreductase